MSRLMTFLKRNKKQKADEANSAENILKVVTKIRASSRKAAAVSDEDLAEYALTLCDVDGLKDAYLNTEFDKIKKLFENLGKLEKKENKWMSSGSDSAVGLPEGDDGSTPLTPDIFDDVPSTTEQLEDLQRLEHKKGQGREVIKNQVRIKILISEIAKSSKERSLRKALAPIMSGLNVGPTFGMFHSGLIVGPWLIEWNNSSLCIPRKCYSSAAVLAVDVDAVVQLDLNEAVDACAKVICEWNSNKQYSQTNHNCQHFVDALLDAMHVKVDFEEPLNHYLNKMRKKGEAKVQWTVPTEIRSICEIKEEKIAFKSHKELDEMVRNIQNKLLEKTQTAFDEEYSTDWQFLKAFDRAFWLRHFKDSNDETYQPLCKGDTDDCPFNHPENKSFTQDWW
ncbi:peptidyl-tRNA hydrolase [Acrasis kona]|uniref:Peptidyl-tRNA hydrolase n=1 Tax=Acrasis kona TaxID=1008807 RepID=A0AAW2YT81_9EUKA